MAATSLRTPNRVVVKSHWCLTTNSLLDACSTQESSGAGSAFVLVCGAVCTLALASAGEDGGLLILVSAAKQALPAVACPEGFCCNRVVLHSTGNGTTCPVRFCASSSGGGIFGGRGDGMLALI